MRSEKTFGGTARSIIDPLTSQTFFGVNIAKHALKNKNGSYSIRKWIKHMRSCVCQHTKSGFLYWIKNRPS